MKNLLFVMSLVIASLLPVRSAHAQLRPANDMGVTFGHVHMNVRDVDAAQKFFLQFGGTPFNTATSKGVEYPGAIFLFTKAEPTGGMEGSTVNHIGFYVKDGVALFAKMQAAGAKTATNGVDAQGKPYGGYVYSPDGVKVEIAQRTSVTEPLVFDQVHFFVADPGPNGGPGWSDLQKWYATVFGVKIERDKLTGPAPGNVNSAPMAQSNIAATNFRFSKQDEKAFPTKGRALDHIGFEIKNLEDFCKKLEAQGIKLDMPYATRPNGLGIAFLTDPMGTRIELNEGLEQLQVK